MRTLSLIAVASILVGCGASSAPPSMPITVDIPAAPSSTDAAPQQPSPAAPRPRHPSWSIAERISKHLRAASEDHRSLELEPSGRVVIKDSKELREEEFYLEDVERVMYELEAGWKQPHWVKVYIKRSGIDRTRWRQNSGPWQLVTTPFLVLPFEDKGAADEVVMLMQSLAGL